jgi:hypothetical protein
VHIQHWINGPTGLFAWSDYNGNFTFNETLASCGLDTSGTQLYRYMAISQFQTDTLYSGYTTLSQMAGLHTIIDCNSPMGPLFNSSMQLEKKGRKALASIHENVLYLFASHKPTMYSVYTLTGVMIAEGVIDSESSLEMSKHGSGIYLVRFYDPNSGWQHSQKLIKL